MIFFRPPLTLTAITVSLLLLAGCSFDPSKSEDKANVVQSMAQSFAQKHPDVAQIGPGQLKSWKQLTNDQFTLLIVDVRPNEERVVSTIPGAISLDDFIQLRLDRSAPEEEVRIVFYDTIGLRSTNTWLDWGQRLQFLHSNIRAYNLLGGILAWTHEQGELRNNEGVETWRVHIGSEAWNLLPKNYQEVF